MTAANTTIILNGETYTNYDGSFVEAQPAIQRFLHSIHWGLTASADHIYWGLTKKDLLVRDSKGVVCIIDLYWKTVNY